MDNRGPFYLVITTSFVCLATLVPLTAGEAYADNQQTVTIISGTPGPDTISVGIGDSLDASASINTDISEKVEASATGVDSLEGNDTITVNTLFTTAAAANAVLLQTPEKKTEAIATSTGINAGDGDNSVNNNLAVNVLGSSLGAYGAVLQVEQPPPNSPPPNQNAKKEIDASVSSKTETTGVVSGAGADSISNDGALLVNGLATSGAGAGDLAATIRESSTMKTTSASEVSSTGIQAGGGNDTIVNNGVFTTTATATSAALSVGLVAPGDSNPPSDQKADIKTESNATSKATVTGIHGDEEGTENNQDDSSPFGLNGLRVTYQKSVVTVSGDDIIINNALQTGSATATSGAGSGSISNKVTGSVETEAKAEAEANVTGINGGGGSDTIVNNGELLSSATANSGALAVAVEVGAPDENPSTPPADPSKPPTPSKDKESKSSTDASATAKSTATGITADGDALSLTSSWTLELIDNALRIDYLQAVEYLPGNDRISNFFSINTTSRATSLTDSLGVTVSSSGSAESKANAEAQSYSASIVSGAGDDRITNGGLLTTESTASATAVSLGLAVGQPPQDSAGSTPPPPTSPDKITSKSAANVTANAQGYGIDADGQAENVTTKSSLSIGVDGLDFSLSRQRQLASGNDTVNNDFAVSVDSSATADSTNASIQLDAVGSVDSETKATADALADGIATGAGDDAISNSGLLTVNAAAGADSVSLGLTASKPPEGETTDQNGTTKKDKTNVKSEAGATATAEAVGIDAEGKEHLQSSSGGLQISGSGLAVQLSSTTESLAGNDSVINTGVMTTTAVADSGAISAGISIEADGSVDSEASSKAVARSGGILTGGGADTVVNQAVLSSDSEATATALSVAVSVAQPTDSTGAKPSTLDKLKERFASANSQANAEATAAASGIDTEGDAGRQVDTLNIGISSDGLLVDTDSTFTSAAGSDSVTNSGALTATSTARTLVGAADVKVQTEGTASSETNATAKADAGGVLTGGGADSVDNSGLLTAMADAEAGSVSVSFTQPDGLAVQSKADSKAVAEAAATGIGTDGGRQSASQASHLDISIDGIDFTYHSEEIASAAADSVINTGAVVAAAQTLSGAGGGAVSMDGSAKADVTANSTSQAVALDTGGGNDFIDNEALLTASSDAVSGALAIAFGQSSEEKPKTKVAIEAGATSLSKAVGISGDSGADKLTDIGVSITANGLNTSYSSEQIASVGNDIIQNRGSIGAVATSAAGGLGVAVAIDGAAKADVNASSTSQSAAIVGGGGDDLITSTGALSATASSEANALAVGVGQKTNENSTAKTKVDAKSESEASATGIAGDGGPDDTSRSATVTIDDSGLQFEYIDRTTASSGDDQIINSGTVTSGASADSGALSVAVTIDGAARADANSSATARAAGLDSGAGSDSVDNSGALDVNASATSKTLNAAISSDGRAITNAGLMDGGNKAEATAVGISSAGGQFQKSTTVSGSIDFNSIDVGARYETVTDSLSGDGADLITNSGSIDVNSNAFAPEVTAGITSDGLAVSIGRTQVASNASAINAGNLDDTIDNSGGLTVNAASTAILANVAVAGKGLAVATNAVWDGGTKAEASANGIDADSGGMTTKVVTAMADKNLDAYVRYNDEFQAASGNDLVRNSGQIDATAVALSPSLNVAINPGTENKTGIAAAVSTSSANADTTAIRGGDGDDDIENTGLLNATADAKAVSANVAVVNKGVAAAADAVWDGGTKAEATAIGIAGDGGDRSRSTYLAIGTDEFKSEKTSVVADGMDTIDNSGEINTAATADAASIGVAVAAKGIGAATSTATAESRAAAIDAGSGVSVDDVYNSGKLASTSTARAAAASVSLTNEGLAVSADSVWDGGTKATAEARGIDVGAGGETLTNDGQIDTLADAATASASIAVSMKGVAGASSSSTGKADAIAIDASEGNDVDTVTNHGALNADATSLSAAASISVVNEGLAIASGASWDGGTTSEARASGIDVGDGGDTIDNTGSVTASSLSGTAEAAVGVAVRGVAGAVATSTSKSTAVAIHAGDDNDAAVDTVTNSGNLVANADAGAVSAAVSFSNAGIAIAGGAVWDGGTHATSDARGIELGAGGDWVDNSGNIAADSNSLVAELAASVSVSGVAGAVATSTGQSSATAIHTGSGNAADTVINSGDLSASSDAKAVTAAVSVTNAGLAVAGGAVWDGGTKGISQARGIYVGEGADVIENQGGITATSVGTAAEVAAAISVSGVAAATATSTGQSMATAIDASEGNDADSVTNSGTLTADSTANAATSTVTVTNAGLAVAAGAVWDGGTKAISDGRGIDVGAGKDEVDNSGAITVGSDARAAELGVSVAVTGVAGAIATSTGDSTAAAIDTGDTEDDDDTVVNSGELTVDSNALAATATVSVTTAGVAVAGGAAWTGGTSAHSQARGIDVGEGADYVDNQGNMTIGADSKAAEAAVAVAVSGVAGGIATATSEADASAIDLGDGLFADSVKNSGNLDVTAHSQAATTSVSVTTAGVAVAAGDVWDGGTEAHAGARGIEVGEGADSIENHGSVSAGASAESAAASISVAVAGVAGAIATSSVDAYSTALDAGAGEYDDTILNTGDLSSSSSALTASAAVSFTAAGVAVAGDASWDGGTSSTAHSKAMALGAGNDSVINEGNLAADSTSSATGSSVAVAVLGVAAAITSAEATAETICIDAGAGNDSIETHGNITASSFANGNTITNSDTKFGVAAAGNSTWDGGAKSAASTSAVAGGSGEDVLTNSGDIDSDATAVSTSTAVTFSVGGVSASISTSTAEANANAIDGGEDDDIIENTGNLTVKSDSNAISANLALAGIGVAVAGDSVWDGGTTSNSSASGIIGGAGNDYIRSGVDDSSATPLATLIDVTAGSLISSTNVSITGAGISGAISTGTANADGRAIDAGDGDDTVINASVIRGAADADATSVSVALTGGGGAGASDAFWDGGTKANADAFGIDGGLGSDLISNLAGVTADATSNTRSAAIAASFGGGLSGAVAASTSTANATGIDGADGDDTILSAGDVLSMALAEAEGVSVSITGGGVAVAGAFSDNTTVADATATGFSGGAGADILSSESSATITVNSTAHARETQVALNLAGMSAASANTGVTATSIGLDGGSDNDLLLNAGALLQTSDSTSTARSLQLTGFGVGIADANSSSYATSLGFFAGAGDDEMLNSGSVDLVSSATSIGQSVAVTGVGANISRANAESQADSTGFAGDSGADRLENEGALTITTHADARAASIAAAQLGYNLGEANSDAASNVTALSGGEGADVLSNSGDVTVDALAAATAASIAVSQFGYNVGKANTIAEVSVSGLEGGTGNDTLINGDSGVIDLLAGGEASSIGVSISVGGVADAEAGSQVLASVTGMQGDAGDDEILNEGLLGVNTHLLSTSSSASVSFFGVSTAKAGTEIESTATGIAGGDGADTIVNTGVIRVGPPQDAVGDAHWMSILRGTATSSGLTGLSSAESSAFASTISTGVDGGTGDDIVSNQNDMTVVANSLSETGATAIQIFGSSAAAGLSGAFTQATGLYGGLGDDYLETLAQLQVEAESQLLHNGASFTFSGSGDTESLLEAQSEATGIDGGAGDDVILAEGSLIVNADSKLDSSNGASAVFGDSNAAGTAGANTRATGIEGGDDNDVIDSGADISLTATSELTLHAVSFTMGGNSDSSGSLAAVTESDGLAGGTGDDSIANRGTISIDALSTMHAYAGAKTTFGGSAASNVSGGVTNVNGMRGDEGNDVLENSAGAAITINARAAVDANAVSYTFAGQSDAKTSLTGYASAEGMRGDSGDDVILNHGTLSVAADAKLVSTGGASSTFKFSGENVSTGSSAATASAHGLTGGDGNDWLESTGSLEVTAKADAQATNTARTSVSIVNSKEAGALTQADASATGLDGGSGENRFLLGGDLDVRAESIGYALAVSSGADFTFAETGVAKADSTASSSASGIISSGGMSQVVNDGNLTVSAKATTARQLTTTITVIRDVRSSDPNAVLPAPETITADALPAFTDSNGNPIDANRQAYPAGDVVFWTQSPADQQDPLASQAGGYYQVVVTTVTPSNGDPSYDVWSWEFLADGLLQETQVEVTEDAFPTYAAANGNGLDGNGTAQASGNAAAFAKGISLMGEEGNSIENRQDLAVTAFAEGVVNTSADGDAFGDAVANSTTTAVAEAMGIELGIGNDYLLNTGNISVSATATAQSHATATGGDICIWFFGWWCGGGGHGYGTANADFTTTATGIDAGAGDNTIINETGATISVVAKPEIRTDRDNYTYITKVTGADYPSSNTTITTTAAAIVTGDGNNTIINNGTISAESWQLTGSDTISVVGIRTGAGNDVVTNNGSVSSLIINGATQTATVGITTGAGNDVVTLGDASQVVGDVDLGENDDTLHLIGTPTVDGDILAGGGTNALIFDGEGTFANPLNGFVRATKQGAGTYAVPDLPTMHWLQIDEGTLQTGSDYLFDPAGFFQTVVNHDGSYGKLSVLGIAELAGELTVLRSSGAYLNGTVYDIVETEGTPTPGTDPLTGEFTVVNLPAPTTLLSFQLNQLPDTLEVEVDAKSFTTVASNRVEYAIARYLDRIMPSASGDLSNVLGEFQLLPPSEFGTAFASLSPTLHEMASRTANDITRLYTKTMLKRAHSLQATGVAANDVPQLFAIFGSSNAFLAYNGSNESIYGMFGKKRQTGEKVSRGIWLDAFGQWGEQDASDGFSGFDFNTRGASLGLDGIFSDRYIAGINLGYATADLDSDDRLGKSDIKSLYASLYGSYFTEQMYIDAVLSYGRQDIESERQILIGSIERVANSDHHADAYSAFIEGGYNVKLAPWNLQPFGNLQYLYLDEDSFRENGADSLDQLVDARRTASLQSNLGLRLARFIGFNAWTLIPEISLAWLHDYDIDNRSIVTSFAGSSDISFSIDGQDVDREKAVVGAGLMLMNSKGISSSLVYHYESGSDYVAHDVMGELRIEF